MQLPYIRRLASWVGLALALGLAIFLRPTFLGGDTTYLIVAGKSMEPTYHTGDLVILKRRKAYATGDVIAYRVDGGLIIHRVVGGSATRGYSTRGDNRDMRDFWQPKPDSIVGSAVFDVPRAGLLVSQMRRPFVPFVALALLVLVLSVGERRKSPYRDEDDVPPYVSLDQRR